MESNDASILAGPVGFARGVLRHDVWDIPARILESVASRPQSRTAVKSCHSSGKTFSSAEAVLWWITAYPDGIAITTAPTWTQVAKLLWGEIRRSIAGARIAYPKPSLTELKLGDMNYALGLSTNEGVRFQGFHAPHILFVMDEAPGVDTGIWEAIEGARAGGDVRILAIGNPVVTSGPFYDLFHTGREGWNLFTISSFDTPNLRGISLEYADKGGQHVKLGGGRDLLSLSEEELDINDRPYLTTRRWVKEKFFDWGPGHALWDSRVLGNFPEQAEDSLFSLAVLEQARVREGRGLGRFVAGLDVAGPGEDEMVLTIREGPRIASIQAWAQADPRGEVVAALMPYRDRMERVNVDVVGIGYYMGRHLADCGFNVVGINAGAASRDPEHFANLKSEFYWAFRERLYSGDVIGLTDDRTIGQLTGIRYSHNARGQIVIESKDDARKRGVKSPDRAESVMLAFAGEVNIPEQQRPMAEQYQTWATPMPSISAF